MNDNCYIIFGGSGFIGTHLVRKLMGSGVRKITIADIKPPGFTFPGVDYVKCDVRNPILPAFIPSPSVVVNLAAIHRTPGHADAEYFETNVKGALNVVEFCRQTGCTTLWFTSSISVYGPCEAATDETSSLRPNTAYGQSKLKAEEIHKQFVKENGDRKLLIVRPGVVFGAGENGNFSRLARALKKGLFVYPGRRDTIKGCGYVEDLVESMFFMQNQPESFLLYNFCYSYPYTLQEICEAFAEVGGLRRPIGTIPFFVMFSVARLFSFVNWLGLSNGIHPARIEKLVNSTYIVPRALSKRGFRYTTDLKQGLLKWLQDDPSGLFV